MSQILNPFFHSQYQRIRQVQDIVKTAFFDDFLQMLKEWAISIYQIVKPIAIKLFNRLVNYAKKKWRIWEPRLNKLLQISVAISSATSTLKLTIEITPVILSVITILSALPLFEAILPTALFQPWIFLPTVMTISLYVGYRKYNEEVTRARLDRQTVLNQREIRKLRKELHKLQQKSTSSPKNLLFRRPLPKKTTPIEKIHLNGNSARYSRSTRKRVVNGK